MTHMPETAMPDVASNAAASARLAWGDGLATRAADGTVLDVWYPLPALGAAPEVPGAASPLAGLAGRDADRGVELVVVHTSIDLDAPPADAADAYLRLHLLSHRLVAPRGLNVDGIFGCLANVVWTSHGPCAVDGFEDTRLRLRAAGRHAAVYGVDKFPRMVDYVVPSGVRIADADRVRLGAHLAAGTTVMHEGFVNFNAGTLGTCMVEGRISAGVVVGDGSDVGGGASIMGTLSGGGREVISIGKNCLLGANSGLGIPLGDNCVVEAGLYVTAGTKVTVVAANSVAVTGTSTGTQAGERPTGTLPDGTLPDGTLPAGTLPAGTIVKARDLAGMDNILFRRNSLTGGVEAVARTGAGVTLNTTLHVN